MQLLSDLPLAGLFASVGKQVTVADKSHFFFGLQGRVTEVHDSITTGTPEKPSQVTLVMPEVVIEYPLIDGATGQVSDARLTVKASQAAFVPPKAPFRPGAGRQNVIDADFAVL